MPTPQKTILISGGASGIGLHLTTRLSHLSHQIFVADLSQPPASSLATLAPDRVTYIHTDITSLASCRAFVARALELSVNKRIDVLVNVAGVCISEGLFPEEEVFNKTVDVNFRGTWNLGSEVLRVMQGQEAILVGGEEGEGEGHGDRQRGAIVCVSSSIGLAPVPGMSIYGASKAAVLGLVRGWAGDFAGWGIRVNAVAPGLIDTPMLPVLWAGEERQAMLQQIIKSVPLGRIGKPSDISNAIIYLLSDEAVHVTGECIKVSGGF
ncbi:NAD(P)-binding protein [Aulographum hederae CBS 113979]|uniref:NAD(P)-binding protein n=1 Tax=Aulographum hederae CBS 113979 TaxID=1176131 RepID=A0A6G1GL56_9PEZI|nr:NAD(P)-binding protein [Aulographum hederae CBS 113979]